MRKEQINYKLGECRDAWRNGPGGPGENPFPCATRRPVTLTRAGSWRHVEPPGPARPGPRGPKPSSPGNNPEARRRSVSKAESWICSPSSVSLALSRSHIAPLAFLCLRGGFHSDPSDRIRSRKVGSGVSFEAFVRNLRNRGVRDECARWSGAA